MIGYYLLLMGHIGLYATVAYTDLRYRQVYAVWKYAALAAGLVAALVAPIPWLNLGLGMCLFTLGYLRWQRGMQGGTVFGGGDVFMFAYAGLTFGILLLGPLACACGCTLLALALGWLKWDRPAPLAGLWAIGALIWIVVGGLLCQIDPLTGTPWESLPPRPLAAPPTAAQTLPHTVTLSPLLLPAPTAAPDPLECAIARQAATTVGAIGLCAPAARPTAARSAATVLRDLAGASPQTAQTQFLQQWAHVLAHYTRDAPGVLSAIQAFSAANSTWCPNADIYP